MCDDVFASLFDYVLVTLLECLFMCVLSICLLELFVRLLCYQKVCVCISVCSCVCLLASLLMCAFVGLFVQLFACVVSSLV